MVSPFSHTRRTARALFLRFLPILALILVDVFFLILLDNLFYNQKRALILESPHMQTLLSVINPVRNGLMTVPDNSQAVVAYIRERTAPILEGDNPWFRVRLTGPDHQVLFEKENQEKFKKWNNQTNCLFSQNFEAMTATQVRTPSTDQLITTVAFYYASPKGWPVIEQMVVRYRGYAGIFVAASWLVFGWLSLRVLRPLERVGNAIEQMVHSDRVVMIPRPRHAIEYRFNHMAQNQREVLFGLEIERIVDGLHSMADDTVVVERFLKDSSAAIQKIYPFRTVELIPGANGEPLNLPQDHPERGEITIPLAVGNVRVGTFFCRWTGRDAHVAELEIMRREIQKQAENGLARAFTRSRALTEERNRFGINLATNMGHDLTNIIASGKWDLDTIQRAQSMGIVSMDPGKGVFFQEAVEGLKNNLHFLQEMVDIYRSFGYTRRPRFEPVSLPELTEQVSRLFRLSTSQKLILKTEISDPVTIIAEPRLLRMAIFNLLANAAQAIRRSEGHLHGEILVQVQQSSPETVTFFICDNGPGIRDKQGNLLEKEEIGRIFQSGYSTKDDGSGAGLGLAWVQSIIRDFHNGTIEAANRPEGGAQFIFTLPMNHVVS